MIPDFSRRALILVCLTACRQQSGPAAQESDSVLAAYVAAQADSGAAAWNRGDLVAFLAPYADSLVVVYPDGPVVGRNRIEALQRANAAWNGVRPADQARIGGSQLRRLDPDAAVQTA